MDRRYYGFKALIVVLGIAVAIASGTFGAPRMTASMAHIHYGAGASVELALAQSTAKASHELADFLRRHACASINRF